ncbi:inner membrane protein yicO [Pseudomassariella vexata]|uniref:Inner membrane protein yicO n=1 Tax=Pseudomassariella vexata TaxID=1141098 RepID=A0A1Y2E833_9PEZI|nr:inner membrane protein yicO [Pseudomassariella vexata]ORY67728.1 inner membrane protein yicO [Pseudomassariella vexata]
MGFVHNTNAKIATSPIGRWFRLDGSGHHKERKGSYFFTELRAGLATFFAMAYIIAVNASIIADTGGTCVCNGGASDPICNDNTEYNLCVAEVRRDMVTATAAISALASFCMGLFANLPLGLAPGMGVNAYFAYTVVGFHGSGQIPYSVALTAIFVEGWIFFALAIFGMRQWLARAIPRSIKLATGVGIGLFLTLIGLTYSEGIGLILGSTSTPTELAGCHPSSYENSENGLCPNSDKMRNPTMWIGIFCGGIMTTILMMYRVKGAIIMGILLVSIISWPRTTSVTYFPYTAEGDDAFDFFRRVVDFHQMTKVLNVLKWDVSAYGGQFGLALITFLYVDILDCTATLYSMARFADVVDPVTEDFEGSSIAYMVDAVGISIGAVLGTSPVTAYIESGAGISEGGKTGLTAMVTGICFFISIFFAPIFASIPPWATGCVLILVGSMMIKSVTEINWTYMGDAVPAFITIMLMPFTYSIANGLVGGVCSYILINTIIWLVEKASGGRIVPHNKAEKDPWTWRVPGGVLPPWTVRLANGKKDFWREDTKLHHDVPVEGESASAGSDGLVHAHAGVKHEKVGKEFDDSPDSVNHGSNVDKSNEIMPEKMS